MANQTAHLIQSHIELGLTDYLAQQSWLKTDIQLPADEKYKFTQEDEPIIQLADKLIQKAIESRASDIHIEPYQDYSRIRFRCDGILTEITSIPPPLATRLMTRLKMMANLNMAEKRLPQDGHLLWQKSMNITIRINTCPTLFGEKIVLRLLDKTHIHFNLDQLGLLEQQKKLFISKLIQPQGILFVTGPTGSGKTITLYAALHYLNCIEKNISTIEDPVEIALPGINQVNANPKIGLDFSTALRSFLRQDPDIIMIGEIRDAMTAQIALQAAQTGHLVLSTLHTNYAIEAIHRLQSLGITDYSMLNSISFIIAQRLVRQLCRYCKQADQFAYRAVGCEHCREGYHDRIGIFECIPITPSLAQLIATSASTPHLIDEIKKSGWISLRDAGMQMVQQGITTATEITRVLGTEERS